LFYRISPQKICGQILEVEITCARQVFQTQLANVSCGIDVRVVRMTTGGAMVDAAAPTFSID
jgi:hypothetical protein